MHVPIITLSVEGMKHTIHQALSQHAALLDKDIQAAVDEFCKPERISAIVREQAERAMRLAIEEEVRNFFAYSGAGRNAIAESVRESLLKRTPQSWVDPT